MKGNNLSDVKKANRQVVYECIWSHKAVTMTDIAYMTHLSRPTVTSLVQEMTADNLVVKSGYGTSNGGRSPVLYHANAGAAYAIWNVKTSAFLSVSTPGTQIKTR